MLFCIRQPKFVQIGAHIAVMWHNVDFSRWRPRPLNTISGFIFVDDLPTEGQSLSANQISSTYLNWRLRYHYFRFGKKERHERPPYSNFSSGFDFGNITAGNGWPHTVLRHHWLMPISCHFWDCKALLVRSLTHITSVQTFTLPLPLNAEIWRHINFSRWLPTPLNTTSGFLLVDATLLG